MRHFNKHTGFALPAVLVVVGGMLILSVGVLLVASVERDTARSFVDRQRAELAASAGLEEIRSLLAAETANDDFVLLQSTLATPLSEGSDPAPHLFIARSMAQTSDEPLKHRYIPLFSTLTRPSDASFTTPKIEPLFGENFDQHIDFTALPYHDKVRAAWLPVRDENGRTVARYAYWIEDLQSRVDPAIAGNDNSPTGAHLRVAWPFPAPGMNDRPESVDEAALDQIALFALDPAASDPAQGELGKTLIKNRKMLISPDAQLAAAGIQPPLARLTSATAGGFVGDLVDPKSRAIERGLTSGIQPYLEQALVPYVAGIDPAVAGKPKLNLNRLLAGDRAAAVDEMAAFIQKALPDFEQRKGGFPEDYPKTLAANALDYADEDDAPTLLDGVYRGIDSYPLTTELVLKVDYRGMSVVQGRQFLNFNLRLFAELYNPSDVEVSGNARLSYEVALKVSELGSGTVSEPFDSADFLSKPDVTTHDLDEIDGGYWSQSIPVSLKPNEYRCYRFADVTYRLDQGLETQNPIGENTPFSLVEDKGERGSSLMWNDVVVERQQRLLRQAGFIFAENKNREKISGYLIGEPRFLSKAHLPGLLYQMLGSTNTDSGNTGDPRISLYLGRLKDAPLEDSAFPQNASPNRRSLRRDVYLKDSETKPKVYARMLPSEWPDGGHDSAVGTWSPGTQDETEITASKFDFPYDPESKHYAIQRISNRGYFFSATELGHIFDPIMFAPIFENEAQTARFLEKHTMPAGVTSWPDVKTTAANPLNALYGGGNTLRIGRPEHPAFSGTDGKSMRASSLLDLFHAGQPLAADAALRTGPLVKIHGHVNLNTASRDALRTLAAGKLMMDPKLSKRTDKNHATFPLAAPPVVKLELDAPKNDLLADKIADAIIAGRPYASPSEMVTATDPAGEAVFGNRKQYADAEQVQWSDSAAEEVFARVHQAATVRSRNFRVWIVAQAVSPENPARVLAEVRKVHTVFVEPGERETDGALIPENLKTRVLFTNEF